MCEYDVFLRSDMEALAADLLISDRVQRACAVTFSLRRGIMKPSKVLQIGLDLVAERFGEARAMGKFAAFLAEDGVLEPMWDKFHRALANGHKDGDGIEAAKVDAHSIAGLVLFMSRMGWVSPRFNVAPKLPLQLS
jgi:hypothetical protein